MPGPPTMADTSPPSLNLYILTFNCGRNPISIDALSSQLFSSLTSPTLPHLLILSLQEIAPVPHSLIGGSFILPYLTRFHTAIQNAARKHTNREGGQDNQDAQIYTPIVARNLGMTALLIFALDPSAITNVETGGVGTGFAEMGNKGACGARFTYTVGSASTELTFVAAHLAAMEWELARRNEDWKSIVRQLVFTSSAHSLGTATHLSAAEGEERPLLSVDARDAGIYKPTSHLFVAGDLNYRTSSLPPLPTDHLDVFPQPNHDASSPKHISSLYERDQLNIERVAGRTMHGLIEAPVTFPPTYKYNSKEPFLTRDEELVQWHWASHRWPSWCDRILYLPFPGWVKGTKEEIRTGKYTALPLFPTSDHRAVALEVAVPLISIPKPDEDEADGDKDPRIHPPFDIDINWKSRRQRARVFELVAGFTTYFTTTAEGGGVVVAMLAGAVGAYFAIRALLL